MQKAFKCFAWLSKFDRFIVTIKREKISKNWSFMNEQINTIKM